MDITPIVMEQLEKLTITELRCIKAALMHDMEKSNNDSPGLRGILAEIQALEQARVKA